MFPSGTNGPCRTRFVGFFSFFFFGIEKLSVLDVIAGISPRESSGNTHRFLNPISSIPNLHITHEKLDWNRLDFSTERCKAEEEKKDSFYRIFVWCSGKENRDRNTFFPFPFFGFGFVITNKWRERERGWVSVCARAREMLTSLFLSRSCCQVGKDKAFKEFSVYFSYFFPRLVLLFGLKLLFPSFSKPRNWPGELLSCTRLLLLRFFLLRRIQDKAGIRIG